MSQTFPSPLAERFQAFLDHPDNLDPPDELRDFVQTFETLKKKPQWHNCIGGQVCYPSEIREPTSLADLVSAVEKGRDSKLSVRAVGSGHSFSDVAPCYNGGILLKTCKMNKQLSVDVNYLRDPGTASSLFQVESGMTIKDLNQALDQSNPPVALINMGAYDGQTLAGAISTGTHGTGMTLGPIASSVRSLVIVADSGTVYRVEPSNGITDPANFDPGPANIVLQQNDDWFQTCLVAMGCVGLIYSYTIEVMPAYFLNEERTLTTWEAVKQLLALGIDSPVIKSNRHFEVDINPYIVKGQTTHTAIQIVRNFDSGPARGTRGRAYWLAGVMAQFRFVEWLLVKYLNDEPHNTPKIINKALHSLQTPKKSPYVAKSFEVMNLGAVDDVKAYAVELSIDASENLVGQIDNIISVFEQASTDPSKGYLLGPIALRFVAPASPYLAPQQGRPTCMVELDMLFGIKTGCNLLTYVKNQICTSGSGVRVHWGLDLDLVTAQEVPNEYPLWDRWLGVYKGLNTLGLWNNNFTDRLSISTKAS